MAPCIALAGFLRIFYSAHESPFFHRFIRMGWALGRRIDGTQSCPVVSSQANFQLGLNFIKPLRGIGRQGPILPTRPTIAQQTTGNKVPMLVNYVALPCLRPEGGKTGYPGGVRQSIAPGFIPGNKDGRMKTVERPQGARAMEVAETVTQQGRDLNRKGAKGGAGYPS